MKKQFTKLLFIYCSFFLFISSSVFAKCNFISADYLNELDNPNSINKIKIEIPKSAKYAINFYKVLASKSDNIPPELRRTFLAKISVIYKFGTCVYNSKIRQHGDWKDHIDEKREMRSLKINLKEGNILNAVKFRLLLPETRGNLNEILGALLLKKLDFISPETFEIETEINGVSGKMLFQEDIQKELLEKNYRREGPIFEGDESLLWSKKRHHTEYENLVLSRLTNSNWFKKNSGTQNVTLTSYSKLQKQYLDYSQNIIPRNKMLIFPNKQKSLIFEDYLFILLVMNGKHGLRPHNRKYYYNSFLDEFEPIYYDGDLSLLKKNDDPNILEYGFRKNYKFKKIEKFNNKKFLDELFQEYKKRLTSIEKEKIIFFNAAISQITLNSRFLQELIDRRLDVKNIKQKFEDNRVKYLKNQNKLKLKQTVIKSIKKKDDNFFVLNELNQSYTLFEDDIINIISRNNFKEGRYIFIPEKKKDLKNLNLNLERKLGGSILYSQDLSVDIDIKLKKINISQKYANDWILFKDLNLENWKINFKGNSVTNHKNLPERLNNYGMTGCLNFYNIKFNKTTISGRQGLCEDTINIVNSYGNLSEILVEKAASDAIDLDFSNIKINSIKVFNAINDCLDVSSGTYSIYKLNVTKCGDKGISVGEKSKFTSKKNTISFSSIGISSKDSSKTILNSGNFSNTKICYEIQKKKQEFMGAILKIGSIKCDGKIKKDDQSIIRKI